MTAKKTATPRGEGRPSDGTILLTMAVLIQAAPAVFYVLHLFPFLVENHVRLLGVGLCILSLVAYSFYFVLWKTLGLRSLMGFFFFFIAFTAYIDTFISLCLTSPSFFLGRFYLDRGEKYFNCAYGFMCLFWDGTFHVAIQSLLAFLAFTNREYHFVALVWSGSIVNSMAPLLLGGATGPYSQHIQAATALNGPYVFLPVAVIFALLSKTPAVHRKEGAGSRVKSHSLLVDLVLMTYNFLMPLVHIVRAMCVMGSKAKVVDWWLQIEPVFDRRLLIDRNDEQDYAFMAIQAVQWAFWFAPWHWAALFEQVERIRTNKRTVVLGTMGVDFSAIVFGAYLQSIACHIASSYLDMHEGVPGLHVRKVPLSQEFWLLNIATLIGALLHFSHFHVQDVEDSKQD